MSDKYVGKCRKRYEVWIPCNCVKDGFCGVDARPCVLEDIHEV